MVQIHDTTQNQSNEHINMTINLPDLDFDTVKQMAKEKAIEISPHSMILSWKNSITGQTYPDYECGVDKEPFWIRYAKGRGANLTIDVNDGDYIFMALKFEPKVGHLRRCRKLCNFGLKFRN